AGGARVLIPSVENMLIHLAAHSAVHGNPRRMWLRDIRDWAVVWRRQLDWDRVIARGQAWGLALPLGQALERAETTFGEFCPPAVRAQLRRARVGWRDRLALRQAPRDADHPVAHVLVDAICTGNFRLIAGYLRAVLLPDSRHMGEWYCDRHRGWLITAHLMRWTAPLLRQIPRLWGRLRGVEVREHPNGAVGVFMLREVSAGERILRHGASPGGSAHEASPAPTLPQVAERGMPQGAQRYLRHCCRPNAEWCETGLRALKSLSAGTELTVDYGVNACACRKSPPQAPPAARCA
ncbi:MAG: SET domain-containing protein-lysine N-methyltransferase, partial [bacterium]|nr:SET domain-containing protein-lysine N-methyltransferase [bacterium]